jgi:hypothetical protein
LFLEFFNNRAREWLVELRAVARLDVFPQVSQFLAVGIRKLGLGPWDVIETRKG